MACVNQTRPHCVNQMGKRQSKPLAAWHGWGKACVRHGMCELAFREACSCFEMLVFKTSIVLYQIAQYIFILHVLLISISVTQQISVTLQNYNLMHMCRFFPFLLQPQYLVFRKISTSFRFNSHKHVNSCLPWYFDVFRFDVANTKCLAIRSSETRTICVVAFSCSCILTLLYNCSPICWCKLQLIKLLFLPPSSYISLCFPENSHKKFLVEPILTGDEEFCRTLIDVLWNRPRIHGTYFLKCSQQ
jgi:hypothetical protein